MANSVGPVQSQRPRCPKTNNSRGYDYELRIRIQMSNLFQCDGSPRAT